ncbi:hypothetical protein PVK06_026430 [Gossypium arboreum]|uniref:Uncharacterized protein n=1 Tax=Gossypium arboreum TaxID=29729 RepID=A0ABR0NXN1_GOSAR|nr:hypothetical protein PVK06_026430 [Gossypium arboreum]
MTVEEEVLEHIHDANTTKESWDILVILFSKRNDTKLQLLEGRLLSMAQHDMTIHNISISPIRSSNYGMLQ